MEKYGDLVSYIRQSILRYGEKATQKMQNVGVKLKKEQVAAIILQLNELTIPKDICLKNRYWDPFVLEIIYKKYSWTVPAHPNEKGAAKKLNQMLKFLRDTPETNAIFAKSIPNNMQNGKGRGFLCSLCMQWAKETPLSVILSKIKPSKKSISDEIEDTIEILQNTVSYKVPLLLKPIFDIKNPDSAFLSCMQAGAYNKVSKMLIEIGVPRECALYLFKTLFISFNINGKDDVDIETEIRGKLISSKDTLPYWIRVQLNFLG